MLDKVYVALTLLGDSNFEQRKFNATCCLAAWFCLSLLSVYLLADKWVYPIDDIYAAIWPYHSINARSLKNRMFLPAVVSFLLGYLAARKNRAKMCGQNQIQESHFQGWIAPNRHWRGGVHGYSFLCIQEIWRTVRRYRQHPAVLPASPRRRNDVARGYDTRPKEGYTLVVARPSSFRKLSLAPAGTTIPSDARVATRKLRTLPSASGQALSCRGKRKLRDSFSTATSSAVPCLATGRTKLRPALSRRSTNVLAWKHRERQRFGGGAVTGRSEAFTSMCPLSTSSSAAMA